ncbi:carboxypeptidase-like regulatory domain-containing protein [Marivirga harenae]|uniref:TonB-dependent receptor n=1 Tax=Marivirga harenae TaxID=2010992 RepID=UPI0026DF6007|nr:carboxypeptidase-like regulatory domain-containing protein [Marivirga harenae]WKV13338.1 TonB-dependent receptor plug domain-containing protein [Marivirga harenae]|tara:strand:+ start:156978 stop:159395 length:2418 start_codon:yes stop_codon:yes gene_type:complete
MIRITTFCLSLFVLFSFEHAFSQEVNVSGYVRDATGKEKLIGAHIINVKTKKGVITDHNGYFALNAKLNDSLRISYAGYKSPVLEVNENSQSIFVDLQMDGNLKEVKVMGVRDVFQPMTQLKSKDFTNIPTIGAAPDVLKAVQLFPGITAQNEGSSQLIVRGGSPGENLYMIDNIPLIYVNHLGGFYSVFNPDMINSMEIYKDGFPARYGGKLSSIISLSQYEGNAEEFKGNFSIGPMATSLMVEGPALNKKATYMLSARKTMIDGLMALGTTLSEGNDFTFAYGFHDFNGKFTYNLNDKHTLSANFYQGDDYLNLWAESASTIPNTVGKSRLQTVWGNWLGALQWKYKPNARLVGENSLSVVRYRLKNNSFYFEDEDNKEPTFDNRFQSSLMDNRLQSDWKYFNSNSLTTHFGAQVSYKTHQPNNTNAQNILTENQIIPVLEGALYFDEHIDFWENSSLKVGGRFNYYQNDRYSDFDFVQRGQLAVGISSNQWLLARFTAANQYAHLLYTTGDIGANEIWIPADEEAPASRSTQYSLGYKANFQQSNWQMESAIYYKELNKLTTYKEGVAAVLGDSNWKNKITSGGKGESMGWETMLKKSKGRWTGFASYTLSKTEYQFPEINNGNAYVFEYDRPHIFNVNLSTKMNDKWDFSANWTYQTGLPFTPAVGLRNSPDPFNPEIERETLIYGERNSGRMRDFHRLDLGFNYHKLTKRGNRATWTFSIYNAYSRQNPYFNYYHVDGNTDFSLGQLDYSDEPLKLYQRSFFPFLPSFSYKVYFDKGIFKRSSKEERANRPKSNVWYHKE